MKKEVLFVLLDDFADWEGAFLSTALNMGLTPAGGGTDYIAKTVSPLRNQVRSIGGMTVTTDYTAATMPHNYAGLILIGGMQWRSQEAQDVIPMVREAVMRSALVGGICNASLFLGAHGFLNEVRHTSNTLALLKEWGGKHYTGDALYEERQAVRDGNIITANGTGYLEFTCECLLRLKAGTPEQIESYYLFNKQGLYEE